MLQSLLNILTETTNSIMPGESTSQETEQTPTTNANNNNNNNDTPTTAATASSEVLTTATTAAATTTAVTTSQPFVRPPPPPAADPEFMEVYDCAKLNNNWHKVSTALTTHPEWLSRIPEGRRWTMLHQIVFSGDVVHLNEALSSQINNVDFRLLCKALDDKTVREVASDRAHIHPQMLRRIERLVASDQLLNNAKDNKWDLVKQCINLQPDIANEKPPYRHFYLAHQLAFNGDLNMFKELSEKCHFKLDVLADNKTISQIAREQNHTEFAEHIDTLINQANESSATANGNETTNENDDDFGSHDSDGPYHFSPGFYEDPGISFLPANLDLNNLFPNSHHHTTFSNFGNHNSNYNHYFVTHSLYHGPHHGTMSVANLEHNAIDEFETNAHEGSTSVEPKPVLPSMTDEEQTAYEQKVKENVQNMSHQNLLNSITCRLTKKILHDPVVAADGFTYERQAILEWFQHSKRSPVTDEELENFELKPNYAIKSILQLLQENNSIQPSKNENAASSK